MESRMEKYYKEDLSTFERSKRNAGLYKEVAGEISDMDNLPIPDNSNEIDLNGLKEIISSRDEYRKSTEESRIVPSRTYPEEVKEPKKDKVYDINVLLENAKNEVNRSNTVLSKKTINANFLTNLEDADIPSSDDAMEISTPMPGTEKKVSSTDSLPLDILMDLKGSDNTIVTDPIVKDEVTMIKKIKDGETFYSGSFNFTKKDFDEAEDDEDFLEENHHTGLKVFFIIIGVLLLLGAVYLILTKYVL